MKFEKITDPDFKKMLELLNPRSFLDRMFKDKMIEEITDVYGDDVNSLCENACAWALSTLHGTDYFYSVEVIEGRYNGYQHFWLKVGDYYVDLTLAQFTDCPDLAVVRADKPNDYEPFSKRCADEYLKDLQFEIEMYEGCA